MIILGLTGSIGTGKSTVTNYLIEKGIVVFDADAMVKELYQSKDFCQILALKFGEEILDSKGYVNIPLFSSMVFQNKVLLEELNQLIHPNIRNKFRELTDKLKIQPKIVVYDIPLLYEARMEDMVDYVALVSVEEEKQIERIKQRDPNRSVEQIHQIISSQMSQEEKKAKADYILDNNGTKEELYRQIEKMFSDILESQEFFVRV